MPSRFTFFSTKEEIEAKYGVQAIKWLDNTQSQDQLLEMLKP